MLSLQQSSAKLPPTAKASTWLGAFVHGENSRIGKDISSHMTTGEGWIIVLEHMIILLLLLSLFVLSTFCPLSSVIMFVHVMKASHSFLFFFSVQQFITEKVLLRVGDSNGVKYGQIHNFLLRH
jgi:hypothetical protein